MILRPQRLILESSILTHSRFRGMVRVTQHVAGLIGCGFIGKTIAIHLDEHFDDIQLRTIYDEYVEMARKLSGTLKHHPIVAENPDAIMDDKAIDLLIEAASTEAARKYVPNALRSGKNVLMMSVGALADIKLFNEVTSLAHSNNVRSTFLPERLEA